MINAGIVIDNTFFHVNVYSPDHPPQMMFRPTVITVQPGPVGVLRPALQPVEMRHLDTRRCEIRGYGCILSVHMMSPVPQGTLDLRSIQRVNQNERNE